MRVLYFMRDRIAGNPPPGVAGLLSGNMIPKFISRGITLALCANGSKLNLDFPVYTDLKQAIDEFQPHIIYNLVAEMNLYGMESYIQSKGIKYIGDATHGKFIPEESMRNFDFICQSQLLYNRLTQRGFKAHRVTPFIPTSEIEQILNIDYVKQGIKHSKSILYMHNGDKGVDTSIRISKALEHTLYITIADIPSQYKNDCMIQRLGCVPLKTKQALMLSCDALVYCPPSDGFIEATCTSAMESLLVGLPIIGVPNNFGKDMCVFQYIEEGKIPSIVRNTPEELIEAIKSGELSKINRNEVREKAQAYFNNDRSIDEYITIFKKVWNGN